VNGDPAAQRPESGDRPAEPSTGHGGPACRHLRNDHRRIEDCLDRLFAELQNLTAESVPLVRSIVQAIQRLSALHFEKEEEIFYPAVRKLHAALLDQMDEQHETVREVESALSEMLDRPPRDPDTRWLNELRRLGVEFHDHVQHHIVDEEDHLFRVAGEGLSGRQQAEIARAMAAVERRAQS